MNEQASIIKDIGERLQRIRKKINLLQKDFAQELEISGATLSEIEAGNLKPGFEVYYNLTKKYDVDIYYLLHGIGAMFRDESSETMNGMDNRDEFAEFITGFLENFRESNIVRYSMITHFTAFLLENERLIEKNIKKTMRIKETANEQ
jgi:transcriptional regulator with XRE-family HTH domain